MSKRRWVPILLAFLLVVPLSVPAFGWDKIVAFGDSLSDNGSGICRASNGLVWLDYLADSMRDVELEDRALCGAQTDGPWVGPEGYEVNIGMIQQVNDYIQSLPADADLSGILFTVWIGGNDFLQQGPSESVISAAITNINDALQALVFAGAEDILVMNLPDLGLAPALVNTPYSSGYTLGSMTFNSYLAQLVCDFRATFPKVKFFMADTFDLLQYAVANGKALGFTNVEGTCVNNGDAEYCEGFIFWDQIHPTTATHQYLAALALGQVKHGRVDKEMEALLKELNPIQPRKPFVVQCGN